MKKIYLVPKRILASSGAEGSERLLHDDTDMAVFHGKDVCKLSPAGFVLLDFGMEYNGGVCVIAEDMQGKKNAKIRLRFGESAMECMAEIGYKGATNDHSVRDETLQLPWVGKLEYGHTGFRFIRVDNADDVTISLLQIKAVYEDQEKPLYGTFSCSDDRLNEIWKVGVRTLSLNNNDFITDGIKRDRLVWIGDMHPETMGVLRLFGYDPSICRSLDYIRDITPPTAWMNDIPAYSMWWIIIHRDLFLAWGDKTYLSKQLDYMRSLVHHLGDTVKESGECAVEFRFIDWPSSEDAVAQTCGIQSLMIAAMKSAAEIFDSFGESTGDYCKEVLAKLFRYKPQLNQNKQAAALYAFCGCGDAKQINRDLLAVEPEKGLSTFLCYYVYRTRAEAGDMCGCLKTMRAYHGGMIDLGATTFWEDFDLAWKEGAKPIDALLSPAEYDVHGDNGGYCYQGYRHSLCHGWSAGPVPFLSEYVLGVKLFFASEKKIIIHPDLGDLTWAEGSVPTPAGVLEVKIRCEEGKISVWHNELEGVTIEVVR